ncbi:MAG TPA: substrate binding domain-containing protein, partial [Burkholderiaceae bacterium]|nr:substrate binding domain-containing protein [Burkholderiaceae bacterium]
AIRMGDLADDATLAARRLAVFSFSAYASAAYLKRHGVPPEPEALMEHDALLLLSRTGEPVPWVLTRGEERWEGVPPGRATANSPELLLRLARQGAGITMAPDLVVDPFVRSGDLVQVLPDWKAPVEAAWAVFPGRRLMPARTRAFLDTLQAEFASPKCQERQAQVDQHRKAGRSDQKVRSEK